MAAWSKFIGSIKNFFSPTEEITPNIFAEPRQEQQELSPSPPRSTHMQPSKSSHPPQTPRSPQRPSTSTPIEINLGIDFGTKYSKVCYRDVANNESAIVNFGFADNDWGKALIPSSALISTDEHIDFLGCLNKGYCHPEHNHPQLEYLKMRLAGMDMSDINRNWNHEQISIPNEDLVKCICACFLFEVISKAKEWISQKEKEKLSGRNVRWTANIGVPVEFHDSPAINTFEAVAAVAWKWSQQFDEIDSSDFTTLKTMYSRDFDNIDPQKIDCFILPEVAAAVQSFISSREAREGTYVYFDIGAGTFDSVAFRFWRQAGEAHLSFYSGEVQQLGVNAVTENIATQTNQPVDEVENLIMAARSPESVLAPLEDYKKLMQTQVVHTLDAIRKHDPRAWEDGYFREDGYWPRYILGPAGIEKYVFIGGGGMKSGFYQQTIMNTYDDRKLHTISIPQYALAMVPNPADFKYNGIPKEQFHRFSIAYGLSMPLGEAPDVSLPSQSSPAAPSAPVNRKPNVPDYSDTKDLT